MGVVPLYGAATSFCSKRNIAAAVRYGGNAALGHRHESLPPLSPAPLIIFRPSRHNGGGRQR